ncbi:MAG TPA: META domain-containing protein, partial [Candidatus Binatia bacterium]|nr:META domain-containing protein [Candidatus Binatia bacterium]
MKLYATLKFCLTAAALLSTILLPQMTNAQKNEIVSDLSKGIWELRQLQGKDPISESNRPFISFNIEKQRVGGNSGCNLFGGSLLVNGNDISITSVISTKRACIEDGGNETETAFFRALEKSRTFSIKEGILILFDEDG